MANSRTFATTPESLQSLSALLASHDITADATQPSGEVKQGKWDITWSTPAPGQTTLTMNSHPFGEEGIFWSKITSVLAKTT